MFRLAKTALKAIVLLFAAYAFAFVPLGEHTGLEHLTAILSTPEAHHAGRELRQVGERVVEEFVNPLPTQGRPELPVLSPPQSKLELPSGDLPTSFPQDASVRGTQYIHER